MIIAILILLLIFIILISTFFVVAISDARNKKNKEKSILKNLPDNITIKAIVRYNIGRPQGKFLMIKSFQGSGVLYVKENKIIFVDSLDKENHIFDLRKCEISWVKNKKNSTKNTFKIIDHKVVVFFYIEQNKFIFDSNKNMSTFDLFDKLVMVRNELKKVE